MKNTNRTLPVKLVFFTVFLDLVGFGIVLPILPLLALDFGASAFLALLLQAIFSVMQFVFAPAWGRLSDRIGRRPVLVLTTLGMSLSYLLFALSSSLWVLFFSRALTGAFAANIAIAQALIADNTTDSERASGMGLIGAAIGVGFVVGPILAGFSATFGDIKTPFYVAAVLSLINCAWARAVLPADGPGERKETRPGDLLIHLRGSGSLKFYVLFLFFVMFCFAMIECSMVVLAKLRYDFEASEVAWLFALFGLSLAITQLTLSKRLSQSLGDHHSLLLGGLIMGLSALSVNFIHSQAPVYIAIVFFAIGDGICFPAVMSAISRAAPEDQQGELMGFTQSVTAAARIIAPVVAGFLFDYVGATYPYILAAMIMIALSASGGFGRWPARLRESAGEVEAVAE